MSACPSRADWIRLLDQTPFESVDTELHSHLETCEVCRGVLEQLCDSESLREISQNGRERISGLDESTWEQMRNQLHATVEAPSSEFHIDESMFVPQPKRKSLGRFRLEHPPIGQGAAGVVYLAEDTVIGRTVALKLPRHTALTDPNRRISFLREAQAAGSLRHPNIVSVYDAGEIDGVCYLAAPYCPGKTLEEWLKLESRPIPSRMLAQIIAALADAVHYAHQSKIIHRDLKPTNILIDFEFSSANLPFRPQITDFGLAKLVDAEEQDQTAVGVIKGTVAYMAPEQIQQETIGAHTDIYSLGAILYEMLTGRIPFQGQRLTETFDKILHDPPIPPRRIDPSIPRDLQAICLKCLEKRPQDRYATALDLHHDLVRFCNGETVSAHPTSPVVQAWRWAKRRPSWAALFLTIACTMCLGILGLSLHVRQLAEVNQSLQSVTDDLSKALADASEARSRAETSEKSARKLALHAQRLSYASDMKLAARSWRDGEILQTRNLLDRHVPDENEDDLRGPEWYYLDHAISLPSNNVVRLDSSIYWIARSPTTTQIAVSGSDGRIRIIDERTMTVDDVIETEQGEVNSAVYSPDGSRLVSAGDDGTVRIFDTSTWTQVKTLDAHSGQAFGLAFTPDGRSLISCGADRVIHRWNTDTWERTYTYEGHITRVEAIAVSPDGKWLASAGYDQRMGVWNLHTNELVELFHPKPYEQIVSVAFSPDSQFIAMGSKGGLVAIADTSDWYSYVAIQIPDPIQRLEFAADGLQLITGDLVGVLRLWELKPDLINEGWKLELEKAWPNQSDRVYATAFKDAGTGLWTGSQDGKLTLWDLSHIPTDQTMAANSQIHADRMIGSHVLIATETGLYRSDLTQSGEWHTIVKGRGPWVGIAVSANEDAYAASNADGELLIWQSSEHRTLDQPTLMRQFEDWLTGYPRAFSRDGRFLAFTQCPSRSSSGHVHVLDVATGESLWTTTRSSSPGNGACFTPDGRYLLYGVGHRVFVRDLVNEIDLELSDEHSQTVRCIEFSPDGEYFVTASDDGTSCLWATKGFRHIRDFSIHATPIQKARFDESGHTVITINSFGIVKISQVDTGQELLELDLNKRNIGRTRLTSDDRVLVTHCLPRNRVTALPIRRPPTDTP